MNIFVLSENPKEAARMQCDKHVIKMILESAQMLCIVFSQNEAPYKHTHVNHPCTKWARESYKNYQWLLSHAFELCNEYTLRYGKIHKCQTIIQWCSDNVNKSLFNKIEQTPFAQAMPDKYKQNDTVSAYRNYYLNEKMKFAKWKNNDKPDWILKEELCTCIDIPGASACQMCRKLHN